MRPFPAKETKNLGIWITLSSPWRVVSDKNYRIKVHSQSVAISIKSKLSEEMR